MITEVSWDEARKSPELRDAWAQGPGVLDPFCSSSVWQFSAHHGLFSPRQYIGLRHSEGVADFAFEHQQGLRALVPLEAMWLFGAPVLGGQSFLPDLVDWLQRTRRSWDVLLLSGLDSASPWHETLRASLGAFRLVDADPTARMVVGLEAGFEIYWATRSPQLRRTVRRAENLCKQDGLTLRRGGQNEVSPSELMRQIVDIEHRTWKGRDGSGLVQENMQAFYREMVGALARNGALRVVWMHHQGRPVGYMLGAAWGDTMRALQFGFDDDYRAYSVGHLLQVALMRWADEAGLSRYDMGMPAEYKNRWATMESVSSSVWVVSAAVV